MYNTPLISLFITSRFLVTWLLCFWKLFGHSLIGESLLDAGYEAALPLRTHWEKKAVKRHAADNSAEAHKKEKSTLGLEQQVEPVQSSALILLHLSLLTGESQVS